MSPRKRDIELSPPAPSSIAGKLCEFIENIRHYPWRYFPEEKGWGDHSEFKPEEGLDRLFAVIEIRERIASVDIDIVGGEIRVVPDVIKGERSSIVVKSDFCEDGKFTGGVSVRKAVRAKLGKDNFKGNVETGYDEDGKLNRVLAFLENKRRRHIVADIKGNFLHDDMLRRHDAVSKVARSARCTLQGFGERDGADLVLDLAENTPPNVLAVMHAWLRSPAVAPGHPSGKVVATLTEFPLKIETPEQLFDLVREEIRRVTRQRDII